jgi:anti-sigma B factor antagonist
MSKSTQTAHPNVFAPEGAIDLHVAPEIRVALRELIDEKPKRLIVDMSKVTYLDSSGIAVLIGAMQSLEAAGGEFMLAATRETVRFIFESAKLDKYFHLYPTVEAAAAAAA